MSILKIAVAVAVLSFSTSAFADRAISGIWIVEYYYATSDVREGQIGKKTFYCDGRIELEGIETENARLDYVGGC